MYTVDDDKRNEFEEDEVIEEKSWNNGTGLIIKIIIIVICVLVLIWLIKALKNNSGTKDNGESHNANVLKVRLAAEEYFFLKNKKENYSVVNLKELKSYGLVDNVVDANNKVCSETNSKALLDKGSNSYKMTIKLDCSTGDSDEIFYYYTSNLACQNCNGKTLMTGNTNIDNKDKEDKKEEKEEDNNDNSDISNDNGEQEGISCVDWSDWSKDRIYDASLIERTKTLVQGVKYGNVSTRIDYGNWSDYTTTRIDASDNIEVETKKVSSETWSSPKTGTDIDVNSNKIKVIGTSNETDTISCPNEYKLVDDKCYSNIEYTGNLTYTEFNSGKYKINNGLCEGVRNIKYSNGRYELTYINCRYNAILNQDNSKSSAKTIYTYQELISSNVTYYRYRTVTKTEVRENDIYTNQKYEEKDLPEGYVKVPGTEETFYSYKLEACEK